VSIRSGARCSAQTGGGALYNVESTLIVGKSRFIGNQAQGGDGGTSGGNAFGGAIEATIVNAAAPTVTQITSSQ
jgi:hypothetical protein